MINLNLPFLINDDVSRLFDEDDDWWLTPEDDASCMNDDKEWFNKVSSLTPNIYLFCPEEFRVNFCWSENLNY